MSTQRRRSVAAQTVAILDRGGYEPPAGGWVEIGTATRAAVAGTRLHVPDEALPNQALPNEAPPDQALPNQAPPDQALPNQAPPDQAPPGRPEEAGPAIEVVNESTLAAAARLGEPVAGLVFASARNPGGGFLSGAKAQEEDVARCSALYPCLTAVPAFYEYHRAHRDLRYTDRVIRAPEVPVFRDDAGALLDRPFRMSMLVAAAPNLRALRDNTPPDRRRGDDITEVPAILRRRAGRILSVAASHGDRRLVLGAWGCGVFGNDPAVVADAFAAALRRVGGFELVVFAVLDRAPGTPTLRAFADRFPGSR
jgi:uncharacterized protein (TIGR02452 family)